MCLTCFYMVFFSSIINVTVLSLAGFRAIFFFFNFDDGPDFNSVNQVFSKFFFVKYFFLIFAVALRVYYTLLHLA